MDSDRRNFRPSQLMTLGASLTLAIGFTSGAMAQSHQGAPGGYYSSGFQPKVTPYRPVPSEPSRPSAQSEYRPAPEPVQVQAQQPAEPLRPIPQQTAPVPASQAQAQAAPAQRKAAQAPQTSAQAAAYCMNDGKSAEADTAITPSSPRPPRTSPKPITSAASPRPTRAISTARSATTAKHCGSTAQTPII